MSNLGNLLSGGEQSMVALGRALVGNPSVLLLDEPSEGLSPLLVKQVAQVFEILREDGIAIFLVGQNYGLAMRLSDEINIMSKGQIIHTPRAPEFFTGNQVAVSWGVITRSSRQNGDKFDNYG